MSEQKTELPIRGLCVGGRVNAKTTFTWPKSGDQSFYLIIAPPGAETMIKVEVKPQIWGACKEGDPFVSRLTFKNFYAGQVVYGAVD